MVFFEFRQEQCRRHRSHYPRRLYFASTISGNNEMINRTLERILLKLGSHFPALAILGPRRVGKTTPAKMLLEKLPKPFLYFDLENPPDLSRLENPLSFFRSNKDICIIIESAAQTRIVCRLAFYD